MGAVPPTRASRFRTSASAHKRYHRRIARVLAASTAGPIGGSRTLGWSIHMARFHPGGGPWATVVQRGPGPTELVTAEFFESDDIPSGTVETTAGPALVRTFPHDTALPSLPRLLATVDEIAVVRYRPGSRCTVRADTPDGARWLKVFGAGVDQRRAADAAARWRSGTGVSSASSWPGLVRWTSQAPPNGRVPFPVGRSSTPSEGLGRPSSSSGSAAPSLR